MVLLPTPALTSAEINGTKETAGIVKKNFHHKQTQIHIGKIFNGTPKICDSALIFFVCIPFDAEDAGQGGN